MPVIRVSSRNMETSLIKNTIYATTNTRDCLWMSWLLSKAAVRIASISVPCHDLCSTREHKSIILLSIYWKMCISCTNAQRTGCKMIDWVKVLRRTRHKIRSFQRRSSQLMMPICWRSTEETKPNTKKSNNTKTKRPKLRLKNTQKTKPK